MDRIVTMGATLVLLAAARIACADTGKTPGTFEVSPAGAATYTLPIWTPPGPRGIQPSLALAYSSNANKGISGVGWSLLGLTSIERCANTKAQNGSYAAVAFLQSDKLCLNGSMLRFQSGSLYGAPGSTYQTEFADFLLITAVGPAIGSSSTSFVAQGKNGIKYEFGATDDSRVMAGSEPMPLRWKLNKVSDQYGNNYVITYTKNGQGGHASPATIRWTRTNSTATGPTDYVYLMTFTYSLRPVEDTNFALINNQHIVNINRLDAITVKYVDGGAEKTIRRYQLNYDIGPAQSRNNLLTSVLECADDTTDHCLEPTRFTYQEGGGVTAGSALVATPAAPTIQAIADFNGDGRQDLVYTTGTSTLTWRVIFGGPNGLTYTSVVTGLTALAGGVEVDYFLPNKRAAFLTNVGGTLQTFVATDANNDGVFEFTGGVSTGISMTGLPKGVDWNGDGLTDLEWLEFTTTSKRMLLRANLSTAGSVNPTFGAMVAGHNIPTTLSNGMTVRGAGLIGASAYNTSRMDANGDGMEDIYIAVAASFGGPQTTTYQAISHNGTSLAAFNTWRPIAAAPPIFRFNDDNCSDWVENGVQISGCADAPAQVAALPANATVKLWTDWNGDGRTDLLSTSGNFLAVYLSTGSGFQTLRTTSLPATPNYVAIDIDGDRLNDLATIEGNGIRYYTQAGVGSNQPYATQLPDLLSTVTDSNGLVYGADYLPSNHTSFTDGTPTADPLRAGWVVTVVRRARFPDGVGGTYTKTYTYHGMRYDIERGESAGFQQVDELDSRGNVVTKSYYEQTFPKTGLISKREVYQQNGKLISRTTLTNSPATLNSTPLNQRYYSFVSDVFFESFIVSTDVARDGLPASTMRTTYTQLDAATGNVGKVTTVVADTDANSPDNGRSWTRATTMTFAPANSANRCISLLSGSSTAYSTGSNPVTVTRSVAYTPDTTNCRHSQRIVESSSVYRVEDTYGYDAFGNLASTSTVGRNPDGTNMTARTRTTDWGTRGLLPVSMKDPLGYFTYFDHYYDIGEVKWIRDPNNLTTSYEYDSFARIKKIKHPDGTGTTWKYEPCAPGCLNDFHKSTVTASDLRTDDTVLSDSISYLDQFERTLVSRTHLLDGSYQWAESRYDARGRLARSGVPCSSGTNCVTQWIDYTYDDVNRITATTQPIKEGSSATQSVLYAYDGNRITATDAGGKSHVEVTNVLGALRRTIDANNYRQDFGYDDVGSLVSVTGTDAVATRTLHAAEYAYGDETFQTVITDPASGTTRNTFNSLGELVAWTDQKGQPFSAKYDAASRMTERTEPDNVAKWVYGSDPAKHNIGELESVSFVPAGGYSEGYVYDQFGRLSQQTVNIPGDPAYLYDYAYDGGTGLLDTVTYPTSPGGRFAVKYNYTINGILRSLSDANTSAAFWTATAMNARGQITKETFGTSVVREKFFDAVNSNLDKITAGVSANATSIQNLSFLYDAVGNLTQRQNSRTSITENFVYGGTNDQLYRLASATVKNGSAPAVTTLAMQYDALGNIQQKAEDGPDVIIPHTVQWSSANYPTQIQSPSETVDFAYSPDRGRWKMNINNGAETTYYIGELMEKVTVGTTVDYRHFIVAEGATVAILSRPTVGNPVLNYVLDDHQGSVDALVNSDGTVLNESFTAYGQRRDATTWMGAPNETDRANVDKVTRQGYTFQTVLAHLGMNHLNGRVQDAVTGRFLSPDPFVAEPGNTQNWNRYAYAYNNPLTYTDPSGFDVVPLPSNIPQLPGEQYPGQSRDPNWDQPADGDVFHWYIPGLPSPSCRTPAGGTLSEAVCNLPSMMGLGSAIAASEAAKHQGPPTQNGDWHDSVSGGLVGLGQEMQLTGVLRMEYEKRAKALGSIADKATRDAARDALKAEFRAKQTSLFKAFTDKILKERAAAGTLDTKRNNATKTNPKINAQARLLKYGGRALMVVGVGMEVYNVATAPPGQKLKVAAQASGRLAGGLAGAFIGAKIGLVGGPWGVAAGAFLGGIAGAILGEKGINKLIGWCPKDANYNLEPYELGLEWQPRYGIRSSSG